MFWIFEEIKMRHFCWRNGWRWYVSGWNDCRPDEIFLNEMWMKWLKTENEMSTDEMTLDIIFW